MYSDAIYSSCVLQKDRRASLFMMRQRLWLNSDKSHATYSDIERWVIPNLRSSMMPVCMSICDMQAGMACPSQTLELNGLICGVISPHKCAGKGLRCPESETVVNSWQYGNLLIGHGGRLSTQRRYPELLLEPCLLRQQASASISGVADDRQRCCAAYGHRYRSKLYSPDFLNFDPMSLSSFHLLDRWQIP
jgi:hypothetical protein